MVSKFTNPNDNQKILHGSDTDVSTMTIIKYSQEHYLIVSTHINEEDEKLFPYTEIIDSIKLKQMFDLQYGSPMHCINKDDYEWLIVK